MYIIITSACLVSMFNDPITKKNLGSDRCSQFSREDEKVFFFSILSFKLHFTPHYQKWGRCKCRLRLDTTKMKLMVAFFERGESKQIWRKNRIEKSSVAPSFKSCSRPRFLTLFLNSANKRSPRIFELLQILFPLTNVVVDAICPLYEYECVS